MTPQEFKSWFDGFTEAMSGIPTKAQWARVKERVGEIDGKPVTERIYLDRYWPHWHYNTPTLPTQTFTSFVVSADTDGPSGQCFNSTSAMYAVGRNDAQALIA